MAEMTNEQRLRRKAGLIRKLSDNDGYYLDAIEKIDYALDHINSLPENNSFLQIDPEGTRWVKGKIIIGDRDVTDEFFGSNDEFMIDYNISTLMLEAKKVQLLKEQAENLTNYKTLMSPEVLPQFDNIVSPPTTKIL